MLKAFGIIVGLFAAPSLTTDLASASACKAELLELNRLQDSLKVELDNDQVRAGGEVTLSWQAQIRKRRFPAFLVLSFDQPVRFSGDGFMALAPGARAPFGIAWNESRTRAIVPLSKETVERGSLGIQMQLSGNVAIEWSVIGHLNYCASQLT